MAKLLGKIHYRYIPTNPSDKSGFVPLQLGADGFSCSQSSASMAIGFGTPTVLSEYKRMIRSVSDNLESSIVHEIVRRHQNVILDREIKFQSSGETVFDTIDICHFDEVWAVLQALQEHDEVLDDLIHQMQAERRLTKGFNDSRLSDQVEVLGPTLTLDKLRRAIATRCLDRLARPWDERVQLLVAYKKQHRHPRVPKSSPPRGPSCR